MLRLAKIVPLVALVLCCSCRQLQPVADFGRNLTGYFTGNTPLRSVARMEDSYRPDQRRMGINRLVERGFGQREPYTDQYMHIAQFDSDHLVRATAIRALNRARERRATPVFIKALQDPHPLVRQEAAKALANMPDPEAAGALTRTVVNTQEARDVRIPAADALRHYPSMDVARALAGTLGERDFGVAWQARRSLRQLTGQDFRYNEGQWLQYLTGPDRPFGG